MAKKQAAKKLEDIWHHCWNASLSWAVKTMGRISDAKSPKDWLDAVRERADGLAHQQMTTSECGELRARIQREYVHDCLCGTSNRELTDALEPLPTNVAGLDIEQQAETANRIVQLHFDLDPFNMENLPGDDMLALVKRAIRERSNIAVNAESGQGGGGQPEGAETPVTFANILTAIPRKERWLREHLGKDAAPKPIRKGDNGKHIYDWPPVRNYLRDFLGAADVPEEPPTTPRTSNGVPYRIEDHGR